MVSAPVLAVGLAAALGVGVLVAAGAWSYWHAHLDDQREAEDRCPSLELFGTCQFCRGT